MTEGTTTTGSLAAQSGALDRVLGWVGDDDPATVAAKWLAFRRYLLLHFAVESWFRYAVSPSSGIWSIGFALLLTMCFGLGWFERWTRSACELVLIVVLGHVVYTFPLTANHLYLEMLIIGIVVLFDPGRPDEVSLALVGIRWLTVIVLFYTGLKKMYYGYYFDGTFFGHMISVDPRFSKLFGPLISEAELTRLDGISWPANLRRGPFAVDSTLVVLMSNAAWILEMLVPIGLLVPRLRRFALLVGILAIVAIEAAARELFFGALIVNLLLLFSPRDLNRRVLPLFVALYLFLALIALGLVPRWGIT